MYELKNGNFADTETEEVMETAAEDKTVIVGDLPEVLKPLFEELYIPLHEYKRLYAAEILLRVILAEDTDAYGSISKTTEAARKVYSELIAEEMEIENDAE